MEPDQKFAIVVDTQRSRLYIYQNDNGARASWQTTTLPMASWVRKRPAKATSARR
jgi:hypothetical protein